MGSLAASLFVHNPKKNTHTHKCIGKGIYIPHTHLQANTMAHEQQNELKRGFENIQKKKTTKAKTG